jgi:hypothetical protein
MFKLRGAAGIGLDIGGWRQDLIVRQCPGKISELSRSFACSPLPRGNELSRSLACAPLPAAIAAQQSAYISRTAAIEMSCLAAGIRFAK